ncbi:MAG: ATP-binding cassette domain-containing protein, partial [Akkermansia sp.]|nr:ATP-binding cassette domain-containing protein [Akkermansia sp.]
MIIAENLHRSYYIGKKKLEVLHGLSLHIKRGEKVFLCGPSGAGKTTLMYTLAGLEAPQEGYVSIDGTRIYDLGLRKRALFRNQTMGFIFQNYMLMPELTAIENASLATAVRGEEATEKVKALLERVGLGDRMDHLPNELSGGEQQRVAIARALAHNPSIIFA